MSSMRTASPLAVQFCWMALDTFRSTGQTPSRANVIAYLVQDPAQKLSLNEEEARKQFNLVLDDHALKMSSHNLCDMPDFRYINGLQSSHDWYCFECHHPGKVIHCTHCHRVFHPNCLLDKFPPSKSSTSYLCHICKQLARAEREAPKSNKSNIRKLLKIALKKVESKNAWMTLQLVGYLDQKDRNDYIFYKYIDTKMIDERISSEFYSSMTHLLADVEQLMHNIYVMYGGKDEMLSMARSLLRDLEAEHKEMTYCVHCYKLDRIKVPDAMVKPCPNQHKVIWAQRTGSMFWPCKVLIKSLDGSYEVKAFGGKHERSTIPEDRACVWDDVNPSDLGVRTTPALKKAISEMEKYKENLAKYVPPPEAAVVDEVAISPSDVEKTNLSSKSKKRSMSQKKPYKALPANNKKRKLTDATVKQESNEEQEEPQLKKNKKRIRSESSFSSSSGISSPEPMSPYKVTNNSGFESEERGRSSAQNLSSLKNTPNKSSSLSQQASVAASSVHSREMSQSPGSVASSNCRQISTTTVSPSRSHQVIDSVGAQGPPASHSRHHTASSSNKTTPQHAGYASSCKECTPPGGGGNKTKSVPEKAHRHTSSKNSKIESPTITSSSFSPPESGAGPTPAVVNNVPSGKLSVTAVGTKLKINRRVPPHSQRRKSSCSSSDLSTTDSDSSDSDNDAPPPIVSKMKSPRENIKRCSSPPPPDVTQEEFTSDDTTKNVDLILTSTHHRSNSSTTGGTKKLKPVTAVSKSHAKQKEDIVKQEDDKSPLSADVKPNRDSVRSDCSGSSKKSSPADYCISSTVNKEMMIAELTPIIEARLKSSLEAQLRESINEDQIVAKLERQMRPEFEEKLSRERAKWSEERAALLRQHEEQIRQTKRGSWCVGCLEQAKYYCCTSNTMNNSYCSQACLEAHWHNGHQHNCRRRRR